MNRKRVPLQAYWSVPEKPISNQNCKMWSRRRLALKWSKAVELTQAGDPAAMNKYVNNTLPNLYCVNLFIAITTLEIN